MGEEEIGRLQRRFEMLDHLADLANEAEKAAIANVDEAMALYDKAKENRIARIEARDQAKAELQAAQAETHEGDKQ